MTGLRHRPAGVFHSRGDDLVHAVGIGRAVCGGETRLRPLRAGHIFPPLKFQPVGSERIGLDDVRARFQVIPVELYADFRACDAPHLRQFPRFQPLGL